MINVSISEFVTLLVVTFWLRCLQSCVWVLNEKYTSKKRSLIESEYVARNVCSFSPPGVDNATFDRGYSSLRSYQLESSIGAQAMIHHGGISLSCLLGR